MSEVSAIGYAIDLSAVIVAIGLFSVALVLHDIRTELRDLAKALRDRDDNIQHTLPLLSTRARPFSRTPPSSSK